MAEEDQSEAPQQTAGSDEDKARAKQILQRFTTTVESQSCSLLAGNASVGHCSASPCVIEIHDSTTECEEETRSSKMPIEEKAFIARLHSFMKDKGTPIERIPHLGFKQIDLWMIYKAVEKLGGYESIGRAFQRAHKKGEDDKPLPPSKPRKPYKRNQESKVNKADGKRKRSHSEREMDSELLIQRSPDAVCQSETTMNPHFALSLPNFPDAPRSALNQKGKGPWKKKKRMAQASLNVPLRSQREDKERPSVIHCSLSPTRASSSRNCNSSEGSPLPVSSSSSRSPSPLSVSSEKKNPPAGDFTKVIPKSVQLLRPAPIRPTYKLLHSRLLQTDNSLTCTKKLGGVAPWPYQTEKRDRPRTVQQKVPPTQQGFSQSTTTLPASCILSSYDKSARDTRHQQPVHPALLPHRMRFPHSQLMYHPMSVGPGHSTIIGPAVFPYPYSIPLLNPQVGYPLPAMNPIYPRKL
ncbi:hypothetical protein CRENBAI_017125 [Crenichthys baileyi]|uniref:ARID domain-containing protein n=1 Tax=Crenichthys baileyi TaxID=28760 RepID=A0AAV9S4K0_9TELE